jgi:hypothetical protein
MFVFVYKNRTITCLISKNNIHIVRSSEIRQPADMKEILKVIRAEAEKRGFTYKRSLSSWLMEWKAHNYLSDKNIETSRASSVDLNEDEKLIRRFGYFVLALFYSLSY